MKQSKKTLLSLFILVSFLTAFSLNAASSCHFKKQKRIFFSSRRTSLVYSNSSIYSNSDALFEESENELENDFELRATDLPFFLSLYKFVPTQTNHFYWSSDGFKITKPIYIEVSNLRI